MSPWRGMEQDGGMHTDAGMPLEDAAAWVEQQEREEHEQWIAEQEAEEQAAAEAYGMHEFYDGEAF